MICTTLKCCICTQFYKYNTQVNITLVYQLIFVILSLNLIFLLLIIKKILPYENERTSQNKARHSI